MKLPALLFIAIVLHQSSGARIPDLTCPEPPCVCRIENQSLTLFCTSYEFVKKLTPKLSTSITSLNLNHSSLLNVDSKLKYLKNLKHLDLSDNDIARLPSEFPYLPKLKSLNLSRNHLKDVKLSELPKNLETLDLSYNSLVQFPKDWTYLKQLKSLHLFDNPIDCDCSNLAVYEKLTTAGVNIPENLVCHQPKEFQGRLLSTVNCSLITQNLLDTMLADDIGSGDESDANSQIEDDNTSTQSYDQEGFLKASDGQNVIVDDNIVPSEGSGDEEGSGHFLPEVPPPRACIFNCSTPKPLGANDETNASPLPPLKEQFGIVVDDIFGSGDSAATKASSTTTAEIEVAPELDDTEQEKTSDKEVEEVEMVKDLNREVETFPTNDTVIGEMERASVGQTNGQQTMYIIVGLVAAFVVFMIIYLVNKRRKNSHMDRRRRNKTNENGYGEEMKPLGKMPAEKQPTTQNHASSKQPASPENAPLLQNGQNGRIPDSDVMDTKPQIIEENGIDNKNQPEVEVRKQPTKDELLTPQLERVTIKSAEIPDSIPRTPLLVHRQLNNDGEIVTTVISK